MFAANTLFALMYMHLFEEQRHRYEMFWDSLGVAAILAWVALFLLFRYWARPEKTAMGRFPKKLAATIKIVGCSAIGMGIGWLSWQILQPWHWCAGGDRWLAELATCLLGCVGWSFVIAEFCIRVSGSKGSASQHAEGSVFR